MFLKTIVCSGINEKNDINDAIEFLKKYKNTEFGVQCSLKTMGYQTAGFEWLKGFLHKLNEEKIENRIALHLNGSFVTSFCDGKVPDEISDLLKIGKAISRLQLNFEIGKDVFASGKIPNIKNLEHAVQTVMPRTIILVACQANLSFINPVHYRGTKFDLLFDESFGNGILPDAYKPPVFSDVFQGYAGGLSPENVVEELAKIGKVAKGNIFIDAEGKLKQDGSFSLDRAEKFVCNALHSQENNTRSVSLKNTQERQI